MAPLQSSARLQERSLSLDDAQAMRAILKQERELEAVLDDENETEPVKAEALRELEELTQFQKRHGQKSKDNAQNAADTVRKAIHRLHRRLAKAIDANGKPHPVLQPFAKHLHQHLLIPSARFSGIGPAARKGLAGCFTYEPPPGMVWSD